MEHQVQTTAASAVDDNLAEQIVVVLSRAFTGERHRRAFSPEEHAALDAHVSRVQNALPTHRECMPASWLERFPTVRNFAREAGERREAWHFTIEGEGYIAAHASLWAQHFSHGSVVLRGGYIEDVGADPATPRRGMATAVMEEAEATARRMGLHLLGLSTGVPPFYERMGWRIWEGTHTFSAVTFRETGEPFMVLPLTPEGEALLRGGGELMSGRQWRFSEHPGE